MGSLGVIRSLGRAGYPVHAAASDAAAFGLRSRFAAARVRCPPTSDPHFASWLRDYVDTHGIRAIVPSEGVLLAIRPRFAEFSPLLPCHRREEIVYGAMSKFDTLRSFMDAASPEVGKHVPPTMFVNLDEELPREGELEALGLPVFVKVDACHSTTGHRSKVIRADTGSRARQVLERMGRHFRKAIVQGYAPGTGVGAFFLRWQGKVIAEFMHRRLHEVPHTGGISSLRESWFHADVREDALRKLEHLDWEGVGMMEYRWDEDSRSFALMELNARFWGSLHLALYAGIDFPRLLLDAFHGRETAPATKYRVGVRCRQTFPREIHHVWSVLKDPGLPIGKKVWSVLEFMLLSADPRVYSDLSFPGDRGLQWLSIKRFVSDELLRPLQRS